MTKPLPGFHDVHCFMCGQSCGTVTHYGGTHRLGWCEYCADIPHYCYTCYRKADDIKNLPARKESMFKRKSEGSAYMVNVREFTQRLKTYEVGDTVTVVDGSRKEIVCRVEFLGVPKSLDVVATQTYRKR